ncbi:RibD family protein [Histomonas meleagridis]|uniref:RibD family protein n=1 Tax=Histomonas meleagridis TaxID=135588 RepID=UPI00355ABBD0|nr:RibD family protein [Histomonas meleagridis]KAH0799836.1 RibD family protein [Histomonas meleagridis]
MERPYIICHMLTALDGKITGPYMDHPYAAPVLNAYDTIQKTFNFNAFLCGRVTIDEGFTKFEKPDLDENAPKVEEGDYVAGEKTEIYFCAVDPSGKLGWKSNNLKYEDYPEAHIIEILTEKVTNQYLAFLRKMKISYIIAGKEHIDCELAAKKLLKLFDIKILMVDGGGIINYSFLQEGMLDELSILMAPIADGENNTPTLFEKPDFVTKSQTFLFKLKDVQKIDGDGVWLRYLVNNKK